MEKQHKKKIILISVAVLLVIAAIIILVMIFGKKDSYRIIKVYELNGEATVSRDGIGDMDAYQDMVLETGDTVTVTSGMMTLRLDDDKYVYVEPETEFMLVASGNAKNNKTSIELKSGGITSEIQNPLSDESAYEVNTPNSNMAVRGTIYRVAIYYEDGVRYTKVSVFEGKVDSKLLYADGSMSDDFVVVNNGNEILIYDDKTTTDYVGDPEPINYDELPEDVLRILMNIVENGEDIGVTYDELNEYLNGKSKGPFTVTFMYNGSVFGTQTVEKGGLASKPQLRPAQSGSWDYDFSKEITGDTTIEWR